MNVKYFIVPGKKKYTSVHIRFWDSNRIDQKFKTGISVFHKDWSERRQRIKTNSLVKNCDFLNSQLEELERHIVASYNSDYNGKKHISKSWLKERVNQFFSRVEENENYKIYFIDWIEKYIESLPFRIYNGQPIKDRSINNYKNALLKLKSFETHQKKKYRFEQIDLNFHRDFVSYCHKTEKLNNNSIGNLISRIKTLCNNIELEGYPISPQFRNREFSSPKNETFDVYLNEKEINKIFDFDFSQTDKLDNARDLFIIGLRTGLRVSDISNISKENILKSVINITTIKTNQNLTIPIHPQFKAVLEKRNGDLPRKISDQKFNLYIKDVCEEVGIEEMTYGAKMNEETKRKENGIFPKHRLITSHVCRRSFATNLFLAGFENSIIMRATGHKSVKQFISYVKASQDEHVKKLSEYWSKSHTV